MAFAADAGTMEKVNAGSCCFVMEDTRTRGSLARRNDGQRRWVFRRRCDCLEVASRSTDEEEAHVGADVQGHVEKRYVHSPRNDRFSRASLHDERVCM